jgi:mRNA interferase MazF
VSQARRGEIWLIDLGLAQKVRPALVLSVAYEDNERAVVTYVPRTTSVRGTRFEVAHEANSFEKGAFDAQGIGTIPSVKLVRRLGALDAVRMREVERAVQSWLGINPQP